MLDLNLAIYRRHYLSHNDLELVIVDDGSPEAAHVRGSYPWAVHVVTLPRKDVALNPCVALNAGVAASYGNILVLTNPEVVHRSPILAGMRTELDALGPKGYVAAACWGIKAGWWYCHSSKMPEPSTVGRAPMPKGAGLHFCSMMQRAFYDEIGGFSEEYRHGCGYEDNDFLWRLHAAGARFKIADDLVTDHHDCPRSEWPAGGAARNRAIFEDWWPETLAPSSSASC